MSYITIRNSIMWKPIKNFEGLYEVSREGHIKSLGNFPKLRNKVVGNLKPGVVNGYLTVVLTDHNGKRHSKIVHRIVAETFIENPDNLRCVNHKNEIKSDNRVENLEWCSDQYNKEYSNKTVYRFKSPIGEIFETKNMSRFCRENGLQQGNLSKVVAGIRIYHRGWSLA